MSSNISDGEIILLYSSHKMRIKYRYLDMENKDERTKDH